MAIINPSTIIGAGIWSSSSCQLIERVAKRLRYYPSGGSGFVDVRDVAQAAIAVMESDAVGERYIVSAENRSYKNLFGTLSKALGVPPPQRAMPNWLLGLAAGAERLRCALTRQEPLVTREVIRNIQSTYYYHNDKIINDHNFQFRSLDQSLKETAQVYLESQQNGQDYGLLSL